MTAAPMIYVCFRCSYATGERFDRCPQCHLWESASPATSSSPEQPPGEAVQASKLANAGDAEWIRLRTCLDDWKKATGGGFVLGHSVLVWGRPGTRKTRDMLKLCSDLGPTAAIISTEEPRPDELGRIARDLGAVDAEGCCVPPDARAWSTIYALAHEKSFIVIDSVTALHDRETITHLQKLRRSSNAAIVYIAQHSKYGARYSGPAELAHLADCVIQVRQSALVTHKNRAGPAILRTVRTVR